jgi:anthranilate phosphoribosyltransferase
MLRQTRVLTAGVGAAVMNPISYAEVAAYATLHRWEGEDAAELAYFVRILDNRALKLEFDRMTRVRGQPNGGSKGRH